MQALSPVLVIAAAIPIGAVFNVELAALPQGSRIVAVVLAVAVCVMGGLCVARLVPTLGRTRWILLAGIFAAGLYAAAHVPATDPGSLHARLTYPDGTYTDPQSPEYVPISGGHIAGFRLRSSTALERSANGISAELPLAPHHVDLRFGVQAESPSQAVAWVDKGASFQIDLMSRDKRLLRSERVDLPAGELSERGGAARSFFVRDGIGEVRVGLLETGSLAQPSSATPSLVVGVSFFNLANLLLATGKALLAGLALFLGGLVLALYIPRWRVLSPRRAHGIPAQLLPVLLVVAVLVAISWLTMTRSTFVYFWDFRNYWEKTEVMYALLAAGHWSEAIAQFVAQYSADYALLPTVAPALTSLLTGPPTRTAYDLTLAVLYAAPAYLSVAWLGKRLLDGKGALTPPTGGSYWAFASLPVIASFPIFLTPHLTLMPDIGGVALSAAATLLATETVREISGDGGQSDGSGARHAPALRSSIALGFVLALMFLFRRWFVFEAAGIATCTALLVGFSFLARPGRRVAILGRTAVAVTCALFAALPLLCWVAFDWVGQSGKHDYANLYSSYKTTAVNEWHSFSGFFGMWPLLLVLGAYIVVLRARADRVLAFILVGSAFIAAVGFLQIQSPGKQHYYLLMPAFGAAIAALAFFMGRRWGALAAIAPTLFLVVGGCAVTLLKPAPSWMQKGFAGYSDWLPKQQPHMAGYTSAVNWLLAPPNRDRRFCLVASSQTINQSVFIELWQVLPQLHGDRFRGRIVLHGEVDSKAGPPGPEMRQCDILLLGVPFQDHLPGQQLTLQLVQDDVVSGQGFGAAYGRAYESFRMDDGIELRAYTRLRNVTDAEYADLVQRFRRMKGL